MGQNSSWKNGQHLGKFCLFFHHPNKKSLHGGLRTDHPQASMRGIVDSSKIERVLEIIDNLDYFQDF